MVNDHEQSPLPDRPASPNCAGDMQNTRSWAVQEAKALHRTTLEVRHADNAVVRCQNSLLALVQLPLKQCNGLDYAPRDLMRRTNVPPRGFTFHDLLTWLRAKAQSSQVGGKERGLEPNPSRCAALTVVQDRVGRLIRCKVATLR
jgi:hypothetical protein